MTSTEHLIWGHLSKLMDVVPSVEESLFTALLQFLAEGYDESGVALVEHDVDALVQEIYAIRSAIYIIDADRKGLMDD